MTHNRLALTLLLFLFASLACNYPGLNARPTLPPPPTAGVNVPPSVNQPAATATIPNNTETGDTAAPLPTFTPRPSNTTPVATTAPLATETPEPTEATNIGGQLAFTYTINWRLDPNSGDAIATVTLTPSGGDGTYSYFRDELPITGPVFEYRWAKCTGNPGSLRVTSGDGQTVKIDYFEQTPCD